MKKTIAVLPGDGVGPEVTKQAVKVLKKIARKFGHKLIFHYGLIGASAINNSGNPLPPQTLKLCKSSDAILFGAIGDPKYDNNPKAIVRPEQGLLKLRKSLKLFANIRPIRLYDALCKATPLKEEVVKEVDIVFVRELTGGIYFGKPRLRKNNGTTAIDTSIYTEDEIIRAAKIAFDLASKRRKKITSVDKANVLETSRLWRETVTQYGRNFPEIILNHMFVDNAAMQIIKNPKQFDVILTENMFGDILSDEASVIAGSIGLLPSASIGEKHALYEPIHGAYNKAAGTNTANPIGTILSAAMMLRIFFGLEIEAMAIENGIEKIINEGFRTIDISSSKTKRDQILGTEEFGNLLTKNL